MHEMKLENVPGAASDASSCTLCAASAAALGTAPSERSDGTEIEPSSSAVAAGVLFGTCLTTCLRPPDMTQVRKGCDRLTPRLQLQIFYSIHL
jgi:hypothetical protein